VAPVVLVVLAAVAWFAFRTRQPTPATVSTETRSIAVLPFADLSADQASAFLGDGVAETLINALSKVPGLTVSARTSAFSLRDQQNDVHAIGKQLGVATVLIGSIQRAGNQLRIAARAVRVVDDSILWSQTFDRPAGDIFAVQDEVARAVVSALQLTVASTDNATGSVDQSRGLRSVCAGPLPLEPPHYRRHDPGDDGLQAGHRQGFHLRARVVGIGG